MLWLLLLVSLPSFAAEPAAPREVQLEAIGEPSDVDALRGSLEDWLRTQHLELKTVTALDARPAFARVRVTWSVSDCQVEVFRGTGELMRRKSLARSGSPLLVTEAAALVAQTGVQELTIEEKERELSAPPVVEAPVVAPPARPKDGVGLVLGAYVQGRSYDALAPFVFGGGAELGVSLPGAWRPAASLLINYQGPITRDASLVSLQLQTVSFRGLLGVERPVSDSVDLLGSVGGGLDVLIAGVRSTQINDDDLHPRTDPAPFLSASLGVRWRPSTSSAIFLRALVDFDPARRRYRVEIAETSTTILEPWAVRPTLQLGFTFDVISGRAR